MASLSSSGYQSNHVTCLGESLGHTPSEIKITLISDFILHGRHGVLPTTFTWYKLHPSQANGSQHLNQLLVSIDKRGTLPRCSNESEATRV